MDVLNDRGMISILCYRGHSGGPEEFSGIEKLLKKLDSRQWLIDYFLSKNATEETPILIIMKKLIP